MYVKFFYQFLSSIKRDTQKKIGSVFCLTVWNTITLYLAMVEIAWLRSSSTWWIRSCKYLHTITTTTCQFTHNTTSDRRLCLRAVPSVLWCCWLGGRKGHTTNTNGCPSCRRKGIRSVKNEWWGAGMVICLQRGADLISFIPKPHHQLLPHLNPDWFTFLVPAYPGCPGTAVV